MFDIVLWLWRGVVGFNPRPSLARKATRFVCAPRTRFGVSIHALLARERRPGTGLGQPADICYFLNARSDKLSTYPLHWNMNSVLQSLGSSSVFTLLLGAAFLPLGCGSSRAGTATPARGDAEIPASIASQLTACAEERRTHFGPARHAISFELQFNEDGQVDEVLLKDSTLEDQGLEACMAHVLRSLSINDLPMRSSRNGSSDVVPPEARAVMGQEEVLLCLSSPPCLLTLGFLMGAAFLTVQIYVHVAQSSPVKPWSIPKPVVTALPTVKPPPDPIKQDCIDLYVLCTEMSPRPPCDVCLHKCNTQREWPDEMCPNGKK